jgi:nucleoside phosphorylase
MSAENWEQNLKDLEQIKSDWQERRSFFQRELAKANDPGKQFELDKEIKRCDQEIKKINQEIEFHKQENKQQTTQASTSLSSLPSDNEKKPTIGIITALPLEYAAVRSILELTEDKSVPGKGAGKRYCLGKVPTNDEGKHSVVLCLASMGNNQAAVRASLLLNYFSELTSIVMVGIAGGIPDPEKPNDHVRLGDIVISNEKGVVQYDLIKETNSVTIHRHSPRPPSASLLEGVRLLEAKELMGEKPWLKFIDQALLPKGQQRPSVETDVLISSTDPNQELKHPDDPERQDHEPRVFLAPIASANNLLKNPIKRDQLRDHFGVKAVEMEGSGIGDATWNHEVGYLVVRGICDYCDSRKNDIWQPYAAAVAAAYTRALLESMPAPK